MELSDTEAQGLVTTLQQKRCAGDDDLSLITWLSNRFRIGKYEARVLHDSFYRGFQKGADSVIELIDGKTDEPSPPAITDKVFDLRSRRWRSFCQSFGILICSL